MVAQNKWHPQYFRNIFLESHYLRSNFVFKRFVLRSSTKRHIFINEDRSRYLLRDDVIERSTMNNFGSNFFDRLFEFFDQSFLRCHLVPFDCVNELVPYGIVQWIQIGTVRRPMSLIDEWREIISTPLFSKVMNMGFGVILLKCSLVSKDLVTVFECHRKHFLYVSTMVYSTILEMTLL